MLELGPAFYVLLALILLFFFFIYLLIRRTLTGFKEGMNQGKGGR